MPPAKSREQNATRYFFIHCQKTAGTSLTLSLQRIFDESALYPARSDEGNVHSVLTIDFLQKRIESAGDKIQVVTGHFPFCTHELLGTDVTTLTILREPVARTLSYLRHHRAKSPEDGHKSLEEIYDDPFRFHGQIHNHLVKMFSLDLSSRSTGMLTCVDFTEEHLELAKRNLERVDVIGIQENYEAFCATLWERFGWRIPSKMRANATEADGNVSDEFRTRIGKDNQLDAQFYEFAVKLIERRTRS